MLSLMETVKCLSFSLLNGFEQLLYSCKRMHKRSRLSSAVCEAPNVRVSADYDLPDTITSASDPALQYNIAYGKAPPAEIELTDNVAYSSTRHSDWL